MTECHEPADRWRTALRNRLMDARKARDAGLASVLRSAMSAIDNAETPDAPVPSAGAIADSAVGLGAGDIQRRVLSDDDIRRVLSAEIDERNQAAEQFSAAGYPDRAAALRTEATVLGGLLGDVR